MTGRRGGGRRTAPRRAAVVLAAAGLAAGGCGDDGGAPVGPGGPTPPAASCAADTTYRVTFQAVWDASSHGRTPPFPSGAHFSRLASAAHVEDLSFWRPGGIATPGIEQMAETGGVTLLCREVQDAAAAGRSGPCVTGAEASFRSPGSATLTIAVPVARPFLTLVSMIAPSPDWFVGVNGLPLRENACWRPRITVDLAGYDAGTDRGATFRARDDDVTPHEPIGRILALPAAVREVPFARLTLERTDG